MNEIPEDCTLCPRECHADRAHGRHGRCGMADRLVIARAALHMWEEPCISGDSGSGTVFFSGCALGCIFCQNRGIALGRRGKEITADRLARIFLELQDQNAANINLVTAGHFVPQVVQALGLAKKEGLRIPVVYNSGGYEKAETLKLLEGYIDIYLPDFKYMDPGLSLAFSNAGDYADYAKTALGEMVRQTGGTVFDEAGMMKRGVIVRHLVLPGHTKDSKEVLKYLYTAYGDEIYISIMNQYTPMADFSRYPELNRKLTAREYRRVVDYAVGLGVRNGFIQQGETASESFIPDFGNAGVEERND